MTNNKTSISSSSSLYYFRSYSTSTIINKAFEFTTLSIIALILLLSIVSLYSIFHLRRKSRSSLHLQSFNNLWTVRLILVLFVSSWAVNELLLLPYFRETLNFTKQTNLCKLQVVLSLGLLEPGFLVTLLYIINVSINQRNNREKWSLLFVMVMSLPTLSLQIMFLFFTPLKEKLPLVMSQSSFTADVFGDMRRVICTYPLISSVIFCGFAIVYSMGLLLACWRVGSLVINKTIRMRINILGVTVMMALLVQTLFLGVEPLWMLTDEMDFGGASSGVFVSVAVCAVVGEVVLVIKPIMEALETGRDCSDGLSSGCKVTNV